MNKFRGIFFLFGLAISPFLFSQGSKEDQFIDFLPITEKSCSDSSFIVLATTSSGLPVVFSIESGPAIISGNVISLTSINFTLEKSQTTVLVKASQPGNDSFNPASDEFQSFTIKTSFWNNINSRPLIVSLDTNIVEGSTLRLEVLSLAGVKYSWSAPYFTKTASPLLEIANANVSLSGIYSLKIEDGVCELLDISFNVVVSEQKQATIKIYTIITPNNDGKNDIFYIESIELYKNNELTILDSWGTIVYQVSNYNNTWSADNLAPGKYYYLLFLKEQGKTLSGSVSVLK